MGKYQSRFGYSICAMEIRFKTMVRLDLRLGSKIAQFDLEKEI